jgi:Holliday junction resolvasome RuvABC endonuclease subunit
MNEYNIVAIDGSLCNFGISVISYNEDTNTLGTVRTMLLSETAPDNTKGAKRSLDDLKRFNQHWTTINDVINKYECKFAIAEIPSGAQDARAAFAFGGITSMMACLPIKLVPVTPLEAKAVTGIKHADKEDMIAWAYDKYPLADWFLSKRSNKMDIKTPAGLYLQNKNEHLADSIAVAFAGLTKLK